MTSPLSIEQEAAALEALVTSHFQAGGDFNHVRGVLKILLRHEGEHLDSVLAAVERIESFQDYVLDTETRRNLAGRPT